MRPTSLGGDTMRRSIATVSLSGTLPEKLEALAATRFDGVEIFENDLLFHAGPPRDVRRHASDLGLSIDLYQPFRDFEGVPDALFARNLDRAERKFDVMSELGVPLMLVCSNVQPDAIDDDARVAAQLRELAERAAKRGLRVGFEALSWGTNIRTFDRAWRLVEAADHPHLGLILDSFHTLALPDDWSGIAGLPGQRVFFVQLADAPRLGMNPLTLSRHFRNFPGQGDLPVPAFLQAVLDSGYTGTISLEIFNDDFRAAPTRKTAGDAMRSLLYLEESVRRGLETEAAPAATTAARPARRRRRVDLFDPPLPPALSGVAFVEFTVDSGSEGALAALLGTLGFRKAGRHRSKDVALYAQGDIRFILNREPDSFAHSYLLLHGPSVCAIALGADDALAALGRAEAFDCTRFEGRVGPNEHAIPAVRSLDGSLIYFTDEAEGPFQTDFELDPSGPIGTSGLTRIDHIASSLPEGQLDGWILFYRAVLGLEPDDLMVLPDPYGLVRSKTVANRERTVRFPFNISESRNTATARSVSTFGGAGVSHLALATDDIFSAARAVREAGAPVLAMPSNYYDDLAARFGLDDARLARLQEGHILYDRVGEGEFFQLYTLPFQDRFFFEIVERRGGYDAYGAPNAPVRLAALSAVRGRNLSQVLR